MGGAKLDIRDLLIGYNPSTSVLSNFVQLSESGGNTTVSVDYDGPNSTYAFWLIATLESVIGLDLATLQAQGNLIVS